MAYDDYILSVFLITLLVLLMCLSLSIPLSPLIMSIRGGWQLANNMVKDIF